MTFKAIHAGSIMELAEKTWITMKESKSVRKSGPTLKGGDEWPSGLEASGRRWSPTQLPSQNGFFFRGNPVRKHGVLHLQTGQITCHDARGRMIDCSAHSPALPLILSGNWLAPACGRYYK